MSRKEEQSSAELRRLGITIAIVLALIGWLFLLNGFLGASIFSITAVVLLTIALIIPSKLGKVYTVWVSFANVLGFVIPKIILFIVFYLVLTPIGFTTRILGRNLLSSTKRPKSEDQQYTASDSYWVMKKNESFDSDRVGKQY